MNTETILISALVMALVTYGVRVLPFALFHKKIENRFIQSFLAYMPYGVLTAMVFPGIFSSTSGLISALCGTAMALVLAFQKKGLLPVALAAAGTVFVVERILERL